MKRIGIAASKISKGNKFLYISYVILIAMFFSLLVFIIAGSTVICGLVIMKHLGNALMDVDYEQNWKSIMTVCMVSLTIVITLFNLAAIAVNLKPPKL